MRKTLLTMLFISILPSYCCDPSQSLKSSINTLKETQKSLDNELNNLANWINIAATVTVFLATIKATKQALPDKNDRVIPIIAAAASSIGTYKLASWLSPQILLSKPFKNNITPWVTSKKSIDNITNFEKLISETKQEIKASSAAKHDFLSEANKEKDSRIKQVLFDSVKE